MGAGASTAGGSTSLAKKKNLLAFDEVPLYTVADLLNSDVPDGTRVQVLGHVEACNELLTTPFFENSCVASEVVGAMAWWKPQSALDLYRASRANGSDVPPSPAGPSYTPFMTVLRASRSTSFALRDPPCAFVVESPDRRQNHIAMHEGANLHVVLPDHDWGGAKGVCSLQLGHKKSEQNLRFHAEHGVLFGSQWEIDYPQLRMVSPGRVATQGLAFWSAHMHTYRARVERWNTLVNQNDQPAFMRKYKVTETRLSVGDGCCVIGQVHRTATGGLELRCAEDHPLLITNCHGAAKALPPRRRPPAHRHSADSLDAAC